MSLERRIRKDGREPLVPEQPSGIRRNIVTLWISRGSEFTWVQRIGFALMSLFVLMIGLVFLSIVSEAWNNEDYVGLFIWSVTAISIIALAIFGLVNVLRFTNKEK